MSLLRRILLPSILLVVGYGFWISPEFKVISAGVAIFLFGMLAMEEGFKAFTGGVLERLLKASTDRSWKSLGFGVISTTIMQSSSLVSVITISFLSAGMIGLTQGVGIIFGANLGTTTGAWLVAGFGLKVQIAAYAMPMIVFGVILLFQKSRSAKGIGYILTGLGFLFLGIHYMKDGFEAFKSAIDLSELSVDGVRGLLIYSLVGIFATVVMQSSHATLVLTLTALGSGQITYENGLALAIGANVGTTITAILGAVSANVEGRRLAAAHLIFNLVTGAIAILAIKPFASAVDWVAIQTGIAADDYTLKLAVFHTLFNLVGVMVVMPFTRQLVAFLERLLKSREPEILGPKYLNDAALEFPDAALVSLRNEVGYLYERAFAVMAHGLNLKRETVLAEHKAKTLAGKTSGRDNYDIDDHYERKLKTIYSEIIQFASHLRTSVPEERAEELHELRNAARGIIEAVKEVKHMQANLMLYTTSHNADIRREYNRLRDSLVTTMRHVHRLYLGDDDEEISLLTLDVIKLEIRGLSKELDQRLEDLIRSRRITAPMATSLMTDSGYAFSASKALLGAGRALFAPEAAGMRAAQREISLDEDELNRVLDTDQESQP